MTDPDDIFYIFTNRLNTMCWHNLRVTKSIISSGFVVASSDVAFHDAYVQGSAFYAPFVPNPSLPTGFVSSFTVNETANYRVEYDAECARARHFPLLPSRFSCVYAFKRADDCQSVATRYGWPLNTVQRFKLVSNPLNRVHKANMEVVSLMRGVYAKATWSDDERLKIWTHYWSSYGAFKVEIPIIENDAPIRRSYDSGEIWEYLVEGRLQLLE